MNLVATPCAAPAHARTRGGRRLGRCRHGTLGGFSRDALLAKVREVLDRPPAP